MGAVTFSIDPRLIQVLKSCLPLDVFVETGTFKGDTIQIVEKQFKHIYSVELSQQYYEIVLKRFSKTKNLTLLNSSSPDAIASIMPQINNQSTLFWLDAHWCVASNTAGESSQCPLLSELEAIKQLNEQSIIIIDDARLFLAAPPAPHDISNWPSIDSIIKKLYQLSDAHQITVVNDCIIYFPTTISSVINQFAHQHGVDWLQAMDKGRDYDKILTQCKEKDEHIQMLSKACKDRDEIINSTCKFSALVMEIRLFLNKSRSYLSKKLRKQN